MRGSVGDRVVLGKDVEIGVNHFVRQCGSVLSEVAFSVYVYPYDVVLWAVGTSSLTLVLLVLDAEPDQLLLLILWPKSAPE